MRNKREEPISHPFRSLFELMLALALMLTGALLLRNANAKTTLNSGDAQGELVRRREEMLFLRNLRERTQARQSENTYRYRTRFSEFTPPEQELEAIFDRPQTLLTESQRLFLEQKRAELWQHYGGDAQNLLVSGIERVSYDQETIQFPPGQEASPNMAGVSRLLVDVEKQCRKGYRRIRIEGHTDSNPIYTNRFHSNWELSAARAIWTAKQVEAFLKTKGWNFAKDGLTIEAIGYGERKPRFSNNTEANRRRNRRIEVSYEK